MSTKMNTQPRILKGANPFNVNPELDFLAPPQYGVANWSENMFFIVWNPDENVGIFIHTGRCPADIDLWWAQVFAYLPGREVATSMSWGRPPDNRGPVTGNMTVRCEEPLHRWTLRFDGAGEKSTTDIMGRQLLGADIAVPMSFDVELDAVSPVWDLYQASGVGDRSWAAVHHEQHFITKGWLKVDGKEWRLDGCSFRDHSVGARDFSILGGDHFLGIVFPHSKRTLQSLTMWTREGSVDLNTATLQENGELEIMNEVAITPAEDTVGNPQQLTMTMTRLSGEKMSLPGEILHTAPFAILDPNINLIGVGHCDKDPLIVSANAVKVTLPDGESGYGYLERTYRWDYFRRKGFA
jgi:hypothetical protein